MENFARRGQSVIIFIVGLLSLLLDFTSGQNLTCPYPVDLTVNPEIFHSLSFNSLDSISPKYYDKRDANITVPQIILKYRYPVEIHEITTEDGYILQAHRIPYGTKCGKAEGKRVVWLQHGLLGDSSNYIIGGVDRGLGYAMADACYDVWMGNARGNTYSRKHVNLTHDNPKDMPAYWRFSWHEMGIYDVPAIIDYVLKETKADDLYWVGHSMGTTMFWVAMSERPEYNSKIKLMSALAPVAFVGNMASPISVVAPLVEGIEDFFECIGYYEFLPSNDFIKALGAQLCDPKNALHPICSNILFLIGGFNKDQLDVNLVPIIIGHSPSGSSTRTVSHYGQGVNTQEFRAYDHGSDEENTAAYGQPEPPSYDLSKITAPVALYWGQSDWLATPADVHRLRDKLPNVRNNHRVNHDNFTHLDFIWAIDATTLINQPIMNFIEEELKPKTDPPSTTAGASGIRSVGQFYLSWSMFGLFVCIYRYYFSASGLSSFAVKIE